METYGNRYNHGNYTSAQLPQKGLDSPSRNLRSRTGGYEHHLQLQSSPATAESASSIMLRSTRSGVRRLYNSPLEEELDLMGKKMLTSPSNESPFLSGPPYMREDSPKKFLDLDSPDKKKLGLAMDETAPLSFDVLDPVPPEDYSFSGLMEQLIGGDTDDLNTPQHSPISSPYSNETNYPYTPMTEPETPQPMTPRSRSLRKRDHPKEMDSEGNIIPSPKSIKRRRKSPLTELKLNPRIEFPLTPLQEEWRFMRDGVIIELKLKNFMCHRNKTFQFGPHLNIVTGVNGSGKSAIQAAIMVGCGATASMTGRADSLAQFIQTNESSSMIEIALSNYEGTHSKRKYGEVIKLRKTFTKSSSTTKVLLNDGSWFQLKRREIDSLLRPLQIHLSNPVQILTQKSATNFLKNRDPSELFQSFKDITVIAPAEEFLKVSEKNVRESEHILKHQKKLEHEEMERKTHELSKEYQKILDMEKYKGLCAELMREWCWSHVIQLEGSIKGIEEKVSQVAAKIHEAEEEKNSVKENKEKIVNTHDTERSMLSELRRELANLESKHEKAHEIVREASKENKSISGKLKLLNEGKFKLQRELQELERQMRECISVQTHDNEMIKSQTQNEISAYQQTIAHASQELVVLRQEKSELEEQQESLKRIEDEHKMQLQPLQAQLRERIRGIKDIKDAETTKYDRFGDKMKVLVNRVSRAKWIGKTPIGPLGAWFTVKQEHEAYTPVIEETLGRTLRSFVTDHPEDVNTLRQLILDVYGNNNLGKPGIISVTSTNREGEWWRKGKAIIDGYPTLLDVLDIKHPRVTEALIDKEQIERIVLFKTEQEACGIFKDAKKVPRTCMYGVSMDCFKFTPAPNYKVQPLQQRKKASLLQTTKFENAKEALESEIRRLESEIAEISNTLTQAQRNTKGFAKHITDCEGRIRQKSAELNRAKSLLRTCEQTLDNLEKLPDPASQNDFMEDRKNLLESTLAQREEELQTELQGKEESDVKLNESEKESKNFKTKVDEMRKRIQACDDVEGIYHKKLEKLDKKMKECENSAKTLRAEKKVHQKELETIKKDLKKKADEASKKGERVVTYRAPEDIKSDYDGRRSFYQQNLHKIKTKDNVRRAMEKMKKEANGVYGQIKYVTGILNLVEPLVDFQKKHLHQKKVQYLDSFQKYFNIFVQLRGYTGEALFDIALEKLYFYIGVDQMSEIKAQSYIIRLEDNKKIVNWKGLKEFTNLLSGGEKSYSTVAYISALRQVMPTPFFMLDEFEVFMDSGNKKVGMDILVEQAHSLCDAQFFVFTPHEPELVQDSYIKLFRLKKEEPILPMDKEREKALAIEDLQSQERLKFAVSDGTSIGLRKRRRVD